MATSAAATNPWCYYSKKNERDEGGLILPLHLPLQRSRRSNASTTTCCSWHLQAKCQVVVSGNVNCKLNSWGASCFPVSPKNEWVRVAAVQRARNSTKAPAPKMAACSFQWSLSPSTNTQKVFRFLLASTLHIKTACIKQSERANTEQCIWRCDITRGINSHR